MRMSTELSDKTDSQVWIELIGLGKSRNEISPYWLNLPINRTKTVFVSTVALIYFILQSFWH